MNKCSAGVARKAAEEITLQTGKEHFSSFFFFFFFKFRGAGREKERERNIDGLPLIRTPAGDLACDPACDPGMCPDGESNCQPFSLQGNDQPTEPHQPGLSLFLQR